MNISSTKLPAQAGGIQNKAAAAKAATEEAPAEVAAAPQQDSFQPEGEVKDATRFQTGIQKGIAWGETLEKPLGGMTAIGLAIGSGLALSLGGAMVGGLVGGSFGPAVSSLSSQGVGSFFMNSFSTMGTAVSIGSTIGSVAGIAGGLAIGSKVGGSVAKAVAFPFGFAAGVATGGGKIEVKEPGEEEAPKHKQELRGLFKGSAKVAGGVGLLAGAAGGFVTGATLTAAGSLVVDVAQGDFSFNNFVSQLGTNAMIGGAVAGLGGAAIGAAGGEMVFGTAPQWAWNKTGGKLTANQPGIQERIDKREVELNDRQEDLTAKSDTLAKQTADYRSNHADTSKRLDGREDQMAADEQQVAAELDTVNTRIENNAQADYDKRSATADPSLDETGNHGVIGERKSLDEWDGKLTGWQGDLNNFRSELISWEKDLDTQIDREASAIFGEERKPIDKHFADLHGKLDKFEGKLDKYEVDINNRIHAKYESGIAAEKPGVVSDLRDARNEKERSENQLRNAESDRSQAQSRYNSATRSRDSARNRLRNAESEESSLRSRISSLNSRISRLNSQISSCRSSL